MNKKSVKKTARTAATGLGYAAAAAAIFGSAYIEAVNGLEAGRERVAALCRDFDSAQRGDRFQVVGDHRTVTVIAGQGRIDPAGHTAMIDGLYVGGVVEYRVFRYGRLVRTVS
jgi:hypothetical protein